MQNERRRHALGKILAPSYKPRRQSTEQRRGVGDPMDLRSRNATRVSVRIALAILLAAAGLHRLGHRDQISEYLDAPWLCAVGQGALGLEARLDDVETRHALSRLNHPETMTCVLAERALLGRLGGSCHVPIGGHATLNDGQLELHGLVGHPSGAPVYRGATRGPAAQAEELGRCLAEELMAQGADELLRALQG